MSENKIHSEITEEPVYYLRIPFRELDLIRKDIKGMHSQRVRSKKNYCKKVKKEYTGTKPPLNIDDFIQRTAIETVERAHEKYVSPSSSPATSDEESSSAE